MTWEEFVKVAKSKSRKIKQNFHTYLRFNDKYFYPVLFKIIMLVSFLIFPYDLSIILSRHLKKVKMSSKLITQGFYYFQVSFYLKKNCCEYYIKCYVTWSEFSILRFLVYPLLPDIFDNLNLTFYGQIRDKIRGRTNNEWKMCFK